MRHACNWIDQGIQKVKDSGKHPDAHAESVS
jgi:hypothetical protein